MILEVHEAVPAGELLALLVGGADGQAHDADLQFGRGELPDDGVIEDRVIDPLDGGAAGAGADLGAAGEDVIEVDLKSALVRYGPSPRSVPVSLLMRRENPRGEEGRPSRSRAARPPGSALRPSRPSGRGAVKRSGPEPRGGVSLEPVRLQNSSVVITRLGFCRPRASREGFRAPSGRRAPPHRSRTRGSREGEAGER